MSSQTIYIKIDKNVLVHNRNITLLHFIEEGSKTDSIDDKLKYINSIFDLYW